MQSYFSFIFRMIFPIIHLFLVKNFNERAFASVWLPYNPNNDIVLRFFFNALLFRKLFQSFNQVGKTLRLEFIFHILIIIFIIFILTFSCLKKNHCQSLFLEFLFPLHRILTIDQINFVHSQHKFLALCYNFFFNFKISATLWVSCIQHFNDNITFINNPFKFLS